MKIRCVIIDDEPLAIDLIANYCKLIPALEVKATFTNSLEGLHYLQENSVDLLFLDIQMPEINGIQVLKVLRNPPFVIFTTAYSEHALEGYDLDVVDYLLKPIEPDRFTRAVEKAQRLLSPKKDTGEKHPSAPDYIFVKSDYKNIRVDLGDILYLKSISDYVQIHTPKKKIMTLENLGSLEERLTGSGFCRIHKSYVINMQHIRFVERKRVVISEDYLPIGTTYYDDFMVRLNS